MTPEEILSFVREISALSPPDRLRLAALLLESFESPRALPCRSPAEKRGRVALAARVAEDMAAELRAYLESLPP